MTNLNECLRPVCWLIGRWQSICGRGCYPSLKPFTYQEFLTFAQVGEEPFLNYTSLTWNPCMGGPLHFESGFLKLKGLHAGLVITNNRGVTETEEGEVTNEECEKKLLLNSNCIGQGKNVGGVEIKCLKRQYFINNETKNLEYCIEIGTDKHPLQPCLKAVFEKVS